MENSQNTPLVSIIIPIYKVAPYVRECLASIAAQTYPNIETIIVNDATPDDSMLVVERHLDGVPNPRIINLEKNGGLGNARNVGIDAARGDYIFFVDSDDWIDSDTIKKTVAKAQLRDADVICVDYYKADFAKLGRARDRSPYVGANLHAFEPKKIQNILRLFNLAQIKLYKRAHLIKHGHRFKSGVIYEDVDWTFKNMMTAERVAIVEEPLYYYRVARPGSILSRNGDQHFDILEQYEDVFRFIRDHKKEMFLETVYSYALNAIYTVLMVTDRIPEQRRAEFFNRAQKIFRDARGNRKFIVKTYDRYKFDRILINGNYTVLKIYYSEAFKKFTSSKFYDVSRTTFIFARRQVRRLIRLPKTLLTGPKNPAAAVAAKPVSEVDVVFESYWGQQFSDSPKYLYEYLKENHPEIRCRFALGRYEIDGIPDGDRVLRGSSAYNKALRSSKVWVNNNNFTPQTEKADDQVFIQTFHGIPLKKLGTHMIGYPGTERENWANLVARCAMWDYVVTAGEHHSETLRSAFHTNAKFLEIGSPRTDCLQTPAVRDKMAADLRSQYDIPQKARLVLYAPTWRRSEVDWQITNAQAERLLDRLGPDAMLLVRQHHMGGDIEYLSDRIIDVSDHPDSQFVCAAADILITDYSSIAFDFALTGRPAFFYIADYDEYSAARGLYVDMPSDLSGLAFASFDDLADACHQSFTDPEFAVDKSRALRDQFLESENANTCKTIVEDLILPAIRGELPSQQVAK